MRGRTYGMLMVLAGAIVGAIVFTVHSLSDRAVPAWAMTADAAAGATLGPNNVHQITFHQGTDDVTVLGTVPIGKVLAHAVQRDDVLRPDDLLDKTMVTIPITFKNAAPGIQPGDAVDIYGPAPPAAPSGTELGGAGIAANQLYGRRITVVAVGSQAAIMVPAPVEGYWVELSTSGVPLTAVLSSGISVPAGRRYTLSDAEQVLAGIADSAIGGTPQATATPTTVGGG